MARGHTKTIDKREKYDAIRKKFSELNSAYVDIGVNEKQGVVMHPGSDSVTGSDVTVAEVAFFNEFGTSVAPERSFIRSTVDEKRRDFERLRDDLLTSIADNKIGVNAALTRLGFRISQEIKSKIIKLRTPPNAPSTIAKKGFNNPLIDSHLLLNSIDFQTSEDKK